ncbi:hypothetical protein [Nocardia carnea]|uniref:hypothetical protein n=1 Tax=Nocardia carnea TaxID=37328 RepID=UPI0024562010|nr:hypothetical protein [Nocardia carnea]
MSASAPGPVSSAIAVLSGAVDLRSYPRRTLASNSSPRVEVRKVGVGGLLSRSDLEDT